MTESAFCVFGPAHGSKVTASPEHGFPDIVEVSSTREGRLLAVYVRTYFWRHGLPALSFYVTVGSAVDETTEAIMRLLGRPITTTSILGVGWIRL